MSACEKCWAEYQHRQMGNPDVTYSQVVSESDARGGCSLAEQCGDRHDLFLVSEDGTQVCRCGARRAAASPQGGASE